MRDLINHISEWIKKRSLIFSLIVVIVPFIISRLPFFLYYPFVGVGGGGDSFTYYIVVDQIINGFLPRIEIRSIGYPLFLKIAFLISNKNISIAYLQCMITLVTSIYSLYVIHKYFQNFSIFFSVFFSFFISSHQYVTFDVSCLTESLYTSFIIAFFAILLDALHSNTIMKWILCSLTILTIILIRPSGMFLLPITGLIILYLIFNKNGLKKILAFVLPFTLMLLVNIGYNFYNSDVLGMSNYGALNLFAATSTFLEPKEDNPPQINRAIKNHLAFISEDKKTVIHKTFKLRYWDYLLDRHQKQYDSFGRYYNNYASIIDELVTDSSFYKNYDDGKHTPHDFIKPFLVKMSKDAITSHPFIYFKFFTLNFFQYFFRNMKPGNAYENYINNYESLYINRYSIAEWIQKSKRENLWLYTKEYVASLKSRHDLDQSYYKEFYNAPPNDNVRVDSSNVLKTSLWSQPIQMQLGTKTITLKTKSLNWISLKWFQLNSMLFYNDLCGFILGILFFINLIVVTFIVIVNRNFDKLIFVIFLMLCAAFIHGVLVCMVEMGIDRYSFPMQFTYLLGLPFAYILWAKKSSGKLLIKLKAITEKIGYK